MTLEPLFIRLAADGRVPAADWPEGDDYERYGLKLDGASIVPMGTYERLDPGRIRALSSERAQTWMSTLEVHPCIGSTNVELVDRARHQPVDGTVCTAEIQLQGRGRRGRSWSSPFGANLALSMGVGVDRPPSGLAGVSLVVGLAVADALDQLGVADARLKWPNDVLLNGAKLGGILIEMSQARGTELIIGIGLNVALPPQVRAALPREVADLSSVAAPPSRNELAARIISSVRDFVSEFAMLGFPPFKAAFDGRHYYQGKECHVLLGDQRIQGIVTGLTDDAELILETAEGPRSFNSGEVSLRQAR